MKQYAIKKLENLGKDHYFVRSVLIRYLRTNPKKSFAVSEVVNLAALLLLEDVTRNRCAFAFSVSIKMITLRLTR